jgi:hypothetical protein
MKGMLMFINLNSTLNTILTIGLVMLGVGLILQFFPDISLPGDILIQGENFTFRCPVSSMLIAGVIMAIVLKILRRT